MKSGLLIMTLVKGLKRLEIKKNKQQPGPVLWRSIL